MITALRKYLEKDAPKSFNNWAHHASYTLRNARLKGIYCEFGVYKGGTLDHFTQVLPNITFHGFDSFRGLQEDWGGYKAGHLDLGGRPQTLQFGTDRKVVLHDGFFEDTIPAFTKSYSGPISFMHVDCDLYSSTVTIFKHLKERIVPGTVIMFDEFVTGIPEGDERKAFLEFLEETKLGFNYVSRHSAGGSVSVKMTG